MRTLFSVLLSLAVMTLPASAMPVPAPHVAAAAEQVVAQDQEPAVVIPEVPPLEESEAWTYRYLVPTLIAIMAVALALVGILYGVRLRGRYRVVR